MITELYCTERTANSKDIMRSTFVACQHKMSGISAAPTFINTVSQFVLNDINLSSVIDFPHGLSDTSVRVHSILNSVRKGAKNIDIVINNSLVADKNWKSIEKDIKSCFVVCAQNNLSLRAVIEYRLFPIEIVLAVCDLLKSVGVDTIITSTSTMIDDAMENLEATMEITERVGIPVILSSPMISSEFYEKCVSSNVFGVRFSSPNAVENVFGPVF